VGWVFGVLTEWCENPEIVVNSTVEVSSEDREAEMHTAPTTALEFEGFTLDLSRGCLRNAEGEIELRPKSFELLRTLAENPGRLLGKEELLSAVWPNVTVTCEALTHCVSEVRRALNDRERKIIKTVPKRGYLFASAARPADRTAVLEARPATGRPLRSFDPDLVAGLDLTLPGQPSIAVLPLHVLNAGEEDRIFADGLAQDIMTRLGRARWLFVVARGTVLTLRGWSFDVQEVGRRLGVRYVLQGCVQSQGKRVRLNAALIDTVDRIEIWAEYFDRSIDDIFAIQDEIADAIVSRVHTEIEQMERHRALLTPLANLDAWSAYHRGRWHVDRHTPEDYEHAESLFKFASKLDPSSARVFASLSSVHRQRAFLELTSDRDDEIEQAFELALHSVSLDPHDPQAHWALGRALMLRHEVQPALQEFEAAAAMNPSFAIGHYSVGFARTMAGTNALSDEAVARARRLSPYDPMRFAMLAIHAVNASTMALPERAADLAQLAAGQPNAHYHIIATAALLNALAGRDAAAQKYVRRLRTLCPSYSSADHFRAFPFQIEEHVAVLRRGFQLLGLPPTDGGG
jgi:TolB-like protein/DNA-binding winged helix-turn-helix (wHTH) protein/Tfp pilus assembly protein PilF